ncbi:hypothetical protein M440DRAFT_259636 [Trichoderma longibrachiatum ATCC 18648]|uniref:Uncharacterized protein n=1 Tax=Trichoderma longibrachiatum ATCC 18648 TaxID=983965 RepID=A0A2T4C9X7_TRILO|nr:hypothetical protein M440DRAFT_259636 [Trichoderma longibrachiatum ATCC 18648]
MHESRGEGGGEDDEDDEDEGRRERERERDGDRSSSESFTKLPISPVAGSCGGGMGKKEQEESQGRRARQSSQVPRTQDPEPRTLQQPSSQSCPMGSRGAGRVKPRRTNEKAMTGKWAGRRRGSVRSTSRP